MSFLQIIMKLVEQKTKSSWPTTFDHNIQKVTKQNLIIPPDRTAYLGEIVQTVYHYRKYSEEQVNLIRKLYQLRGTKTLIELDNREFDVEGRS